VNLRQRYQLNVLIWLDEGINTFTGGDPCETVSSRACKARNAGRTWGRWLCRLLDLINPGHCDASLLVEAGKRAVIPDGE
jgi:hypothetical protein